MWSEVYAVIPKVENVFKGDATGVPIRPESLYALSSEITAYARSHHSDDELKNAIDYVAQFPVEFKNRIFADFLQIKGIHRQLYKNRIYDDWFMRSGRYWEDYGIE